MVVPASNTSSSGSGDFSKRCIVWVSRASDKLCSSISSSDSAWMINARLLSLLEAGSVISACRDELGLCIRRYCNGIAFKSSISIGKNIENFDANVVDVSLIFFVPYDLHYFFNPPKIFLWIIQAKLSLHLYSV